MSITPALFPDLIDCVLETVSLHADEVTELDQAIGDGDHVINLRRGLQALQTESAVISGLDWGDAWQKIGMILMASVGGASGSLYATLFLSLAKNSRGKIIDTRSFSELLALAVDAVKQRGKSDVGEKTLLDVLGPVADVLNQGATANQSLAEILGRVCEAAEAGVEATRNMLATKGRASFLGERSLGHIDAGAKTAQLMIAAVASVLTRVL